MAPKTVGVQCNIQSMIVCLLVQLQAGMGGGTGCGAAGVVSDLARQQGAATLSMALVPASHPHGHHLLTEVRQRRCGSDGRRKQVPICGLGTCISVGAGILCYGVVFGRSSCWLGGSLACLRALWYVSLVSWQAHPVVPWYGCGCMQGLESLQSSTDTLITFPSHGSAGA